MGKVTNRRRLETKGEGRCQEDQYHSKRDPSSGPLFISHLNFGEHSNSREQGTLAARKVGTISEEESFFHIRLHQCDGHFCDLHGLQLYFELDSIGGVVMCTGDHHC